MQSLYCRHVSRCFTGKAPVLSRLRIAYSNDLVESWLEIQLYDLAEFSGCKEKQSVSQRLETARLIITNFYYLKVTELMYFFQLFKSGSFGKFYGAVDGMAIMESLRKFLRIRLDEIAKAEHQRLDAEKTAQKAMWEREAMTRSEYDEIKWLLNMGYDMGDDGRVKPMR